MEFRGRQKRHLCNQTHHLRPVLQVGKGSSNDVMIIQIDEALEKHGLIGIMLLQNTDEIAEEVVEKLTATIYYDVVQAIGHMLVLFKLSGREKYRKISAVVKEI